MDYSRLANSWGIRGDQLTDEETEFIANCSSVVEFRNYAWGPKDPNIPTQSNWLYRISPDVLDWKKHVGKTFSYGYIGFISYWTVSDKGEVFVCGDKADASSDHFCIAIAIGGLVEVREEKPETYTFEGKEGILVKSERKPEEIIRPKSFEEKFKALGDVRGDFLRIGQMKFTWSTKEREQNRIINMIGRRFNMVEGEA